MLADIESQINVLAGAVAGLVDGFQYRGDGRFIRRQIGREAALIADRGVQALGVQHLLQGVEHLGAVAHRLGEGRRADGQNHEFLDVDAVIGVRAAVDDVHHRHRQRQIAAAGQMPVQRQALVGRGGVRRRQRHRQNRIGAEIRFALGAVERDHFAHRGRLILRVRAHARRRGSVR